MLDNCVLVGDSIAVGIAPYTKCEIQAKIGRTAKSAYANSWQLNAETTVISLGSNDVNDPNFESTLRNLRKEITSDVVIWILPYNKTMQEKIKKIAYEKKDAIVTLTPFPTTDGIHPQNYKDVAKTVEDAYYNTF